MGKWGARATFVAVALLVVWAAYRSTKPDRAERKRRLPDADPALVQASKELLAHDAPGLSLELNLHEVLRIRSRLKRHEPADREGLKAFAEPVDKTTSILYFFAAEQAGIGRLKRVQVATSVQSSEAVVERVQDRQNRLGPPTGVWDCPAVPGQLPTRRYTYKHGAATAMDVYALIGPQTAITYYVAASSQIRASLKEAACEPTPPERAARFPVAVP